MNIIGHKQCFPAQTLITSPFNRRPFFAMEEDTFDYCYEIGMNKYFMSVDLNKPSLVTSTMSNRRTNSQLEHNSVFRNDIQSQQTLYSCLSNQILIDYFFTKHKECRIATQEILKVSTNISKTKCIFLQIKIFLNSKHLRPLQYIQ